MANRRPPRPEDRGHGPNRRPNAGRPPRNQQASRPRPERQGPGPRPESRQRQESAGGEERLQKILAHAGIGSRRACEDVILQGRVTVNGQVVRELGTKVDSQHAKIAVDGQVIQLERMVYYAVSKPKGYVSTNNDPSGRPRVVDLLPEIPQRVYTVGRLDEMSTGLILLTNDGELANKLAHPKYGVEKLYRVVVAGNPTREVLDKLVEGVWLAEGKVRARRVRVAGKKGQATILEMVLAEGKNREVRRMLAKLGHKVMSLTRVAVGPISLKGLAFGEYRPLSSHEIELLRRAAAGQAIPTARFSTRKPQTQGPGRGRPAGPGAGHGEPRHDSADAPPPSYGYGGGRGASRDASRRGREEAYGDRPRRPQGNGGGGFSGGRGPAGPGARRPSTGRPEYGASDARPTRPQGPPPSQRRPGPGGGPGGRPSYGGRPNAGYGDYEGADSKPRRPGTSGGPRPGQGAGQRQGQRPAYGSGSGSGYGQGPRVVRPSGPPPSQRRPGTSGGPRPGQGQGQGQGQRPGYGAGAGAGSGQGPRVVRPSGPPPSQRRPNSAGGPRKPGRVAGPGDEPRQRRIIGLDGGPVRESAPQPRPKPHVIKRRPPRSALGPRKPRPKPEV